MILDSCGVTENQSVCAFCAGVVLGYQECQTVLDHPIVFDLRSIVRKYWKNHICVINEALLNVVTSTLTLYKGVLEYYDPNGESVLCPTKSVGRSW
jgi:hypothetical protein